MAVSRGADQTSNGGGEWFEEWFNHYYPTIYKHRTDEEADRFVETWDFLNHLPECSLCLDLACGNGRYSRALSRRGVNVIGLDLSRHLLEVAQSTYSPESKGAIHYVRGDMRSLPFTTGFSLIISMFTSFGYFNSDTEHLRLLTECRRLCQPNCTLILDLPNPPHAIRYVREHPSEQYVKDGLGITMERRYDPAGKRVTKQIKIEDEVTSNNYIESVRLFEPAELLQLLKVAGFRQTIPFRGDYQGSPLTAESPRMVFFGESHIGTD